MKSMTGYGQARWQENGRGVTVEIRSVNQRFLEAKLNMPREWMAWEAELRALVQAHVERGKVEVMINRTGLPVQAVRVEPNLELAQAYVDGWQRLQASLGLAGTIDLAWLQARGSEIMRVVEAPADPGADLAVVRATLEKALAAFDRERQREGKALGRDMKARVRHLQKLHRQIEARVRVLRPVLAERLQQRVRDLLGGREISEERLLQEVAIVADRGDVTEELVRLGSHLTALLAHVGADGPVGKKIDFQLQETHREFNTIAAKSNDLEVTNATLEARAEIEKLREQVQNVE